MTEFDNTTENEQAAEEAMSDAFESASTPKQVMVTDEELKALQHELVEYKEKYLRLLADQENSRKRIQKERVDSLRFANESLLIDLLKPIDHMENALNFAQEMSEDVKNWAIGFQMILTQFKEILQNNGVVPYDSKNTPFDPHLHDAVEIEETEDYLPETVIEEYVRGYKMGDKPIRPARVKVSKGIKAEKD